MAIGMFIHRLHPRCVSPQFFKVIPSTLSSHAGSIPLVFYVPRDYGKPSTKGKRYPTIINFHGGGFTIGSATDDARWATAIVRKVDAIVCCVDYRLAPEYPHPTAVEDGTDAVLYLYDHADELSIDRNHIGISGFSAGGNLALTVPLRLQDALMRRRRMQYEGPALLGYELSSMSTITKKDLVEDPPIISLVVAWYPKTDFTQRPRPTLWPDKELPQFLVRLFDQSYIHAPKSQPLDLSSPYLSPVAASDEQLRRSLPKDVLIYTTEWDALYAEGERFRQRLKAIPGGGMDVRGRTILGVRHGWDRAPFGEDKAAKKVYVEACEEVRRVFYGGDAPGSKASAE